MPDQRVVDVPNYLETCWRLLRVTTYRKGIATEMYPRLWFNFVLSCLSIASACWFGRGAGAADPYGLEQRVVWKNERLLGFPEPPPPYKVERAYPKLSLTQPLAIGNFPNSQLMWAVDHQKDYGGISRMYQFPDDQGVSQADVFLERQEIIYGLAFHPKFAENGYLYIGCNGHSDKLNDVATKVVRVKLDTKPPFKADPASAVVIIEWWSNGHNGGDLAFGLDGMLYVSAGDGTSDSDTKLTAQDLSSINGSMIRIDVDHPDGDRMYSVPKDNPFIQTTGARPEIWAYGLRNPWRVTVDRRTGHVWVGNNGQDLWETAHLIRRGENYGWSVMEGSHPFHLHRQRGPTPFVAPTVEHHHTEARSLTGGVVYYGSRLPELVGAYIYGDYSTGIIWAVKHDGTNVLWHKRLARSTLQISGFGVDSQGELIVVDHGGGFYHLVPQGQTLNLPPFPELLSETGLFLSTKNNQPHPGLIGYSVNSPLWSDGAHKERFLVLHDQSQIQFKERGGWDFPEKSVLVKTFSLDLSVNSKTERRRVETRLLVKYEKEWYGYSYLWRDDQSDAELVGPLGTDRSYSVVDSPGGSSRQQQWRFPSRTDCMVCHSRAANYVLGTSTPQMNRQHQYGSVSDNQLRTLAHIGVLRTQKNEKKEAKESGEQALELPKEAEELPKDPKEYARLVDPANAAEPLETRLRAYLEANCAHCHTGAGGGNSRMELTFHTPLDKMLVIDTEPQHDKFGIVGAKVIAQGEPDRSLMLHRISKRTPGQMPPLASNLVDPLGTRLLREWIASLPAPSN